MSTVDVPLLPSIALAPFAASVASLRASTLTNPDAIGLELSPWSWGSNQRRGWMGMGRNWGTGEDTKTASSNEWRRRPSSRLAAIESSATTSSDEWRRRLRSVLKKWDSAQMGIGYGSGS